MNSRPLEKKFRYDPETGIIYRSFLSGWKATGTLQSHGYIKLKLDGKLVAAHRLAWRLYYGEWPLGEIDHINRDKADNRIANLRDVTRSVNRQNVGTYGNNTSGITGVYWVSHCNKWQAKISVSGQEVNLGFYEDKDAAAQARHEAEVKYGYAV